MYCLWSFPACLPDGINPPVVPACLPGGAGCGPEPVLLSEYECDHEFGGKTLLRCCVRYERDRASRWPDAFDGCCDDVVLLHYRQGGDNTGVLPGVHPQPAVCIRALHDPLPYRDSSVSQARKAPADSRAGDDGTGKITTFSGTAFLDRGVTSVLLQAFRR